MSQLPPIVECDSERFRWWYLPSWLGLDAPCVVLTWTWATARSRGMALPIRPAAALFFVVWSIYLADRLLDVSRRPNWNFATGRLRFGRDWQWLFRVCLGFCVAGLIALVAAGLPANVLRRGAVVALGLSFHFLAFVMPLRRKLPGKELGVGLFFALGAYACLGANAQSFALLAHIAPLVAFNCLVIAARDANSDSANDPGGASRWWRTMNRDLLWIGVALTVTALATALLHEERAFYLSAAAAFAALTLLHLNASRLSESAVRALADFALLTPLPIIPLMSA